MNDNHTINGLAYLSIIFAPIIFPIIIWLVAKDQSVKSHAKKALLLHLMPGISGIFIFGALISLGLLHNHQTIFPSIIVITVGACLLVNLLITIYTIILGIKELVA